MNDTNYNVKLVTNLMGLVQAIPLSFNYIFFCRERSSQGMLWSFAIYVHLCGWSFRYFWISVRNSEKVLRSHWNVSLCRTMEVALATSLFPLPTTVPFSPTFPITYCRWPQWYPPFTAGSFRYLKLFGVVACVVDHYYFFKSQWVSTFVTY